jgi:hypothetical protein
LPVGVTVGAMFQPLARPHSGPAALAPRLRSWFALGTLSALIAACSPSVNPAYKASIDQRLAGVQRSEARYEAPASPEPMPLAVGQWSRYELVDAEGRPGFITYGIVGEDGGAYWLEILQESYTSRLVTLMLVDLGDRRDPSTVDVKQMKQKTNDDPVNELPASMLSLMKPMWSPLVDALIVDFHDKPQEPAEAPAGFFDGCYKVQASVSFGGSTWTSVGWSHPAVPISGAVKSRGVDNPSTLDLVELGTSGAKSELM